MRRAAWNVATVLHCVLCALVTLAAAQTPQQCADPTTTSVGTENYARMCGTNRNVACGVKASSSMDLSWHGPATLGNDGILSSAHGSFAEGFFTQFEVGWWRVDFGTPRRVQRVYIRMTSNANSYYYLVDSVIRVGDTDSHSANTVCGTMSTVQLDNVVTCDVLGRYLFVKLANEGYLFFSELMAFGPCACPAGYKGPSVGSAPCVACPANSYKTFTDEDCQVCPLDSVSMAASTSYASCTCKTDFVKHPVTGQCIQFVLRTIDSSPTGFAGSRIASCPPGHVSPADSTSLADCACAPGFSPAGSTATISFTISVS